MNMAKKQNTIKIKFFNASPVNSASVIDSIPDNDSGVTFKAERNIPRKIFGTPLSASALSIKDFKLLFGIDFKFVLKLSDKPLAQVEYLSNICSSIAVAFDTHFDKGLHKINDIINLTVNPQNLVKDLKKPLHMPIAIHIVNKSKIIASI